MGVPKAQNCSNASSVPNAVSCYLFVESKVPIRGMPNTMLGGGGVRSGGLKLFCPGQNFQFSTIYGNSIIGSQDAYTRRVNRIRKLL